ncbi:energy transducer TonB [Sporomusa acidovorans]|uniref:TonB C-terminal domain-containing protein n=1 Tax=Sporomusa acidovorans (strain ATCC 49682 / DSM 3132 / Mol) TaxID=1123286 RepID=A0ABZ3J674_SPOA4|nr:energy transducer TonB [Sporomusa acidovorans]OZC15404.1 gram-negative bacterial tonB protein [Sporomusa acidovorans DSM 3132]SDF13271.1 outer membrane transport energization protein TonB [Sporomusa acidovorans]
MRVANAWGPAFAFALVIHLTGLALAGQGLPGETALEPKTEYMEVELAPAAPPPAREQVQTQNLPVPAVSQGKNLINSNRINTATMPASSGFAAVGDQTGALPGVPTVSEGGQIMSISGNGFAATAGTGETESGGTGNGGEPGAAAPAQPQVEQEPDRRPSVAYGPHPGYPSEARRNRWQGKVIISALVDTSGDVIDVRVTESSGYDILDQSAADVVLSQWRFNPGYRSGQRVREWVNVPVRFKLP